MGFEGFPRRMRYTPVPNPLFGPLLEQIDDLDELKCTLRVVWLLHNKRGYPRALTLGELEADRVLAKALSEPGGQHRRRMRLALDKAVARGTLVRASVRNGSGSERVYALNTGEARALAAAGPSGTVRGAELRPGTPGPTAERPNIFALYEDNIGMLSPHDRGRAARGRGALSHRMDRGGLPGGRGEQRAQLAVRRPNPRTVGERGQERWRTRETS